MTRQGQGAGLGRGRAVAGTDWRPAGGPGPRSWSGTVLAAALLGACGGAGRPQLPPPEVVVAPAEVRDVPIVEEWVGTTVGYVNAGIQPKVEGYLLTQSYRNGAFVKAGEPLFQIDPRQFEAALGEAEGQLGQAEAALGKSTIDVNRFRPLVPKGAVSRQELDDAVQTQLANLAQVRQGRANVDQAKLNLGWTKVVSPIDGVAGIAVAQIGDLVGPATTLTTVSQLDPIKVEFPITEAQYLRFNQDINRNEQGKAGAPPPPVRLTLTNGQKYEHEGRFIAANRQVDPRTGTIVIQAEFPNPVALLRPGLFARVSAATTVERNAVVIPQRAVSQSQGGAQVFVVGDKDVVELRRVVLGPGWENSWIISAGLRGGERVVVEGLQKVRPGEPVAPKPAPAPTTDAKAAGGSPHVAAKQG